MKHPALFIFGLILIIQSCGFGGSDSEDNKEDIKQLPDEQFSMQGKVLAQTAGSHLMSKLTSKIAEDGVGGAVKYCNLVAIPMLDSLSELYQATITRRSDRYRNPANQPDSVEAAIIREYRKLIKEREPAVAQTKNIGSKVRFFAPIITQPLCLNCHGKAGQEIAPENLSIIDSLYPKDRAKSFEIGELRGIWSITFAK